MKSFFIFLMLATYLVWYATFESHQLPYKIDTYVHYIRIQNWVDSLKHFDLFPAWHAGPYFGYPEDFNYLFTYLPLAIIGLATSVAWSIKVFFLGAWMAAGYGAKKFSRRYLETESESLLCACLYMGSASFVNFGLGSGSVTRVAGYAFFPWALGSILDWLDYPTKEKRFLSALIFYASYLFHPICSVCVIVSALVYALVYRRFLWREIGFLGILILPLFAWQFGNLLIAKSFISWTIVYDYYRNFLLPVDLSSFFGFWNGSEARTMSFYFGAFPLLLALASFFWKRKELYFSSGLALVAVLIILSGRYIFGINTYRIDMIYSLGTAIASAFVLSKIKVKYLAYILALLIIFEQTWYARPFGGESYLDPKKSEVLKSHIDPKDEKSFLGKQWPWFVTAHEYQWLSENYASNSEGILELSPASLGILPYVHKLKNHDQLFEHLGIQPLKKYTVSSKYLILEAPSPSLSFTKVYKELLEFDLYRPDTMPLAFRLGKEVKILTPDLKHLTSPDQPNWKSVVIAYFGDNKISDWQGTYSGPGELVIIKEPFHPRLVGDEVVMVEPGIRGIFQGPGASIGARFLWWEVLLGAVSLLTVMSYLLILYRLKKSLPGGRLS